MGLIRIARDGVSRIINLEFLISAELDETTKTVVLRLIEGETISISGKDADRVWTALMLEAEPEPDEDDETEEDETTVDLESINLEISELEDRLQSASAIRFYEGQRLRDSAKVLGRYWTSKEKREFAEQITTTRGRAYAVADEAERVALSANVEDCLTAVFANSTSVRTVLRKIINVEADLRRTKRLTDEFKEKRRNARERAAWYRAKKKLDEVRVAEASGSLLKKEKFTKQAQAMLKQDWATVFPKERTPDIGSFDPEKGHLADL